MDVVRASLVPASQACWGQAFLLGLAPQDGPAHCNDSVYTAFSQPRAGTLQGLIHRQCRYPHAETGVNLLCFYFSYRSDVGALWDLTLLL